MFQKGPQPGYSPKSDCLKLNPNLVCRKVGGDYGTGVIWGYAIFDGDRQIACEASAVKAWELAFCRLTPKPAFCPWCNNMPHYAEESQHFGGSIMLRDDCCYVECSQCGATGPHVNSREKAISEWNKIALSVK